MSIMFIHSFLYPPRYLLKELDASSTEPDEAKRQRLVCEVRVPDLLPPQVQWSTLHIDERRAATAPKSDLPSSFLALALDLAPMMLTHLYNGGGSRRLVVYCGSTTRARRTTTAGVFFPPRLAR